MGFRSSFLAVLAIVVSAAPSHALAADIDEFKVKRQEVYEFTEKPKVTLDGDKVTIRFASKGFCDATVAIENASGKIVRHLASGVLGANAPEPFQKNSLRQAIIWDGKDDRGRYIDKLDRLTVRVSLGLRPRFERTLFWSPHKRTSPYPVLLHAAPEGVYVFEGMGVDHLRLFDHDGNYVRTIYPPPADRLGKVVGLNWREFPQDGRKLPIRGGFYQCSFLTSGYNAREDMRHRGHGLFERAATALAVRGDAIALVNLALNHLATDGSTGGKNLAGPKLTIEQTYHKAGGSRPEQDEVPPLSAAISPDGKWLYLCGYGWDVNRHDPWYQRWQCVHGLARVALDGEKPAEPFLGSLKLDGHGGGRGQFKIATSVACDARGRLYVADYMNDRVQVFSPNGKFIKAIAAYKPAIVRVHQRTGEIYVFSWLLVNQFLTHHEDPTVVRPTLTRFSPLDEARKIAAYPLPIALPEKPSGWRGVDAGWHVRAEVDSWRDGLAVWLAPPRRVAPLGPNHRPQTWGDAGVKLLGEKDGKLLVRRDFGQEARRALARPDPARFSRQRLYVNPATGRLYLAEDLGFSKSFNEVIEITPGTGRLRRVELPFDAEDMAFDIKGLLCLRTRTVVGRYQMANWREVPWDYGEERVKVSNGAGERSASLISGIPLHSGTLWHHGGMSLSAAGHLVVACTVSGKDFARRTDDKTVLPEGKPYQPRLWPGRVVWHKGAILHIFDSHGKVLREDVVQGLSNIDGVYLDAQDNVYLMTSQLRLLDGQPYFNPRTGTVIKFRPGAGRILSASDRAQVPLGAGARPKAPPDLSDSAVGSAWARGAEWLYGGVGFAPTKNNICACSNTRFAVDYFARSFAPEVGHFSVAVLDARGNLILRVGKYGNVDDGRPLAAAGGGPANTRAIGGDEVALFYAPYVATHTDRRLFIADPGNARILGVKLDYHATEKSLVPRR